MPFTHKLRAITFFISTFIFSTTFMSTVYAQINNKAEPNYSISPEPDWVSINPLANLESKDLRVPSHYHLVDRQVNVTKNKQVYQRYVYSLTDASGVSSDSDIKIRFSPSYEELRLHTINILRDGKIVNKLNRSDIQIINSEDEQDSNIYSGEVDALVLLKDVQVGDIIDYSFTLIGDNPVFDNKFAYASALGWGVGVDAVNVNVITPASMPIQTQVYGSKQTITETQHDTKNGQVKHFNITTLNAPAVDDADSVPSWYRDTPYVAFSQYKNWQQVNNWAQDLFKIETKQSSELINFIAELQQLPTIDAINKAIDFVQNDIRYLGLEIGENSHQPHTPSDVYAKRFGDCKDKSLLLSTLLSALDVKADILLVSTRKKQKLNDYLPSHKQFNHVINRIHWQNKTYWIDPTITHQAYHLEAKYQPNYKLALIANAPSSELIDANPSFNYSAAVSVNDDIRAIDYVSPAEWTITSVMTGSEADYIRYKLNSTGKDKLSKQYMNYYAKRYPKIQATQPLEAIDNSETNTITLIERYLIPDYWEHDETGGAEFDLLANYVEQYIPSPKTIIRKHPLKLSYPIKAEHTVTLQLPEDIDFGVDVGTDVFEDEHLYFSSSFDYDRRKLTFSNTLDMRKPYVENNQIADYLTLIKKISNTMQYTNSITNVANEASKKPMFTLVDTLNKISKGTK
ncbi:DUF3857 domain-containing protein [Algibacillus agarilyticus]|uniref:DUF3857 domain-containing protein n=1 Tax=Algibacillus agarilyticus TaxID=2234133 RepID=UPI000DCF877D|nr:DUF3857 domain-containing protein [Algibacillus agarilyticus]